MKYSSLLTFFLLSIIFWTSPADGAPAVSKEKKYSGRFPASKGDLLIDNRYGKLDISTWDRNEVTVEITVRAKAGSEAGAQELMDRVSIEEPEERAGNISYKTIVESRSSGQNMNEINIDYVIYMPRRHTATFYNKYGDVRISDVEGKLVIDLKYGKLTAGAFKGTDNNVRVAYGSATITSVESGMVQGSYSKLSIGKGGNIKVANKYAATSIGTVRSLEVDQKYGDLDIGSVNALRCNIQFASLSVDKLLKSMELNLKYGSGSKFEYVGPEVDDIKVNASYSNLSFHFDNNISLEGDIDLSYGNLKNSVSSINLTSSSDEKSGHSSRYTLKAGSGKGNILVNASYGNITFR